MARIQRVVAVGCPHHITQRGNFRRDVFYADQDRSTYLALLADREIPPSSPTGKFDREIRQQEIRQQEIRQQEIPTAGNSVSGYPFS